MNELSKEKTAGVRTHIVVTIASALFMIVSKYGFTDLLNMHDLSLDPSRIAAQIVTGISFIGILSTACFSSFNYSFMMTKSLINLHHTFVSTF